MFRICFEADIPPEDEWLANITKLKNATRYKEDVREFIGFTGTHFPQPD